MTLGDLTATVKEAVAYARQNGKEKAIAAFNDPNGTFARNGIYIFAEDYDGTALAEPFEHELVGTAELPEPQEAPDGRDDQRPQPAPQHIRGPVSEQP